MLLRFYLTYVVPKISYGLLVCGDTSKTNLEKVYLFQKRIVRTFFFRQKLNILLQIFDLGLETVHEIYLNQLFK